MGFSDKAAKKEFKVVGATETLENLASSRPKPPKNRRRPKTRVQEKRLDLFETCPISEEEEDEDSKTTKRISTPHPGGLRKPSIPIGFPNRMISPG